MNPQLAALIDQARREWAGNRRLRIGGLAIGAILGFYLLLVLRDWQSALQLQYAARTEHLQKMQALAGQDIWIARAQAAQSLRRGLEAEIPEVATLGLAQAGIQTWARDLSASIGGNLQVQNQAPQQVEGQPGIWRVPVVISGPGDPMQVMNLISQIEGRKSLTVIDQATLVNRENRTFSLTVVSLFRIREAPANAVD
jgi:hypothetical protein